MLSALHIIRKPAQVVENPVADDQGPEHSAPHPRDVRGGRIRKCQLAKQECASSESSDTAPPRKGQSNGTNTKSTCSNEGSGPSGGEMSRPQASSSSKAAESQANDAKVIQPEHLQQQ